MPKDLSNINFNAGYNNCNDKVAILRNEVVQRKLDNFEEITNEDVDVNSYVYVDQNGSPARIKLGDVITANATQSDWDQTDDTKFDFIKNKPEIKLSERLISLYNVGGIKAGQIFEEGTPIIDIMKELLSVSNPSMFRFGVVTADERGMIPLDFTIQQLTEVEISTADLIAEGFNPNDIKWKDVFPEFQGEGVTLNDQFFVIAIPSDSVIEIDKCYQAGYVIELAPYKLDDAWTLYLNADDVIIGDQTYYQWLPVTGSDLKFDYRFKLK